MIWKKLDAKCPIKYSEAPLTVKMKTVFIWWYSPMHEQGDVTQTHAALKYAMSERRPRRRIDLNTKVISPL